MVSRHFHNVQQNYDFERQREDSRRKIEAEDAALRQAAERERRGLPSAADEERQRQIEQHNAEVRERQRQYFEQAAQSAQPTAQPQDQADTQYQLAIRDAAQVFLQQCGEYVRDSQSMAEMFAWMDSHPELDPRDPASFHTAFAALKAAGKIKTLSIAPAPESAVTVAPVADSNAGKTLCTDGVYRTERELDAILEQDDKLYRKLLGLNIGQQMKIVDGFLVNTAKTFSELQ